MMDQFEKELTENKLILLYALRSFSIPLTNLQLSRICWELDLMNYFDMQQCLYELGESILVDYFKKPHGYFYDITPPGIKTIEMFQKRIRLSLRKSLDAYAKENRSLLQRETQYPADFQRLSAHRYLVTCRVIEGDSDIFSISFDMPTAAQAELMCRNWKDQATAIYQHTVGLLLQS